MFLYCYICCPINRELRDITVVKFNGIAYSIMHSILKEVRIHSNAAEDS